MPGNPKIWPLLTGTIRYEKCLSTRNRGLGSFINAPILAYLIETTNGRILYDTGCDYRKVADPALRERFFDGMRPVVEPPFMSEAWRIPNYLSRLRLIPSDIDIVFIGHLHFDHAGGLIDLHGCEVHVQEGELAAARSGQDGSVFADELVEADRWLVQDGEYSVAPGVHAIASPGHTAGHMSLFVEMKKGPPVILCGDAADLNENLIDEIAPGYCWQDNQALALASIRKLKSLALRENAWLWPSHDMQFFRGLPSFPQWVE